MYQNFKKFLENPQSNEFNAESGKNPLVIWIFAKIMLKNINSKGYAILEDVNDIFIEFFKKNRSKIRKNSHVPDWLTTNNYSKANVLRYISLHPFAAFKKPDKNPFLLKVDVEEKYYKLDPQLYEELRKNDYTNLKEILTLLYEKIKVHLDEIDEDDYQKITEHFDKIDDKYNQKSQSLSEMDILKHIKQYVKAKGFTYEENFIDNFYLCLKSKPFVLLAGMSGTGKTKLVELFAKAINAEFRLVPVRPDWSDSSDLFGHVDLNGKFVQGAITEFMKEANSNLNKPHILCFDEMNLARVEYYLSDFLSVMETRRFDQGRKEITSDNLIGNSIYSNASEAEGKKVEMFFRENLYIVGTVNMDETTFPFSRKVLDRANTIEFSYVNLVPEELSNEKESHQEEDKNDSPNGDEIKPLEGVKNEFLKSDYLQLSDCLDKERDFIKKVCEELEELNKILKEHDMGIGYRVRDEIVFYMLYNKRYGLLIKDKESFESDNKDNEAEKEFNSAAEAFDNAINQKILPKIQGNNLGVSEVLSKLFIKCAGNYDGYKKKFQHENMKQCISDGKAKYKKSAEKLAFMMRRFEEDGFTFYWH